MKFHQLYWYAPEIVSSIGARIRKFAFGLFHELIFYSKPTLLIKYMNISMLVVYMQQVDKENRKQSKFGERQGKKFRLFK